MNCILEGKQVQDLKKFITAVNNALEAINHTKANGQLLQFDIAAGGDANLLINCVESILTRGIIYRFPSSYLNQLDKIHEALSLEEVLPTTLVFDGNVNSSYYLKLVINKIDTYQLMAIRISTGNHALPIICSHHGECFKLDDTVGRAEEISEEELTDILTKSKNSPSIYYVNVNRHLA
jgi:hypothetical protein